MATTLLNKPELKTTDWINPHSEFAVTLEDYRLEIADAENSGFINLEDHKKTMNKWLAQKLL